MRAYAITRRTAEGPGLSGNGVIRTGTVLETVEADGLDLAGKGAVAFYVWDGDPEPIDPRPGSVWKAPRRRITRVLTADAYLSITEVAP